VEKLRSDLIQSQTLLESEKQAHITRLNEERISHEKEMLNGRSESVKKQAFLKTETISALQRAKGEEEKRHSDYEKKMAKDREAVMTNHLMDEESNQHRFNIEKKRLLANLENKYQDQLVALKRTHEQEITIITKENIRLQRSAARASGAKNSYHDLKRENSGRMDGRAHSTDSYPCNEKDHKMKNKDTKFEYSNTHSAEYENDDYGNNSKSEVPLCRNDTRFPAKYNGNDGVNQVDKNVIKKMETEKNYIYDKKFTNNGDKNVQNDSGGYLNGNDDEGDDDSDDDDSLSDDYNDKKRSLEKRAFSFKNNSECVDGIDTRKTSEKNGNNRGISNDRNDGNHSNDYNNVHNDDGKDNDTINDGKNNDLFDQNNDNRDKIFEKSVKKLSDDHRVVLDNDRIGLNNEEGVQRAIGCTKDINHTNIMNDDSNSEIGSSNSTCSSYVSDDMKEKEGNLH
jgi:hypothetical protein